MKKRNSILRLTQGALVCALYVCLALTPGINALSYGPIQFRISEALMVMCLFSPTCAVGVSVGCFMANLFSPYGVNMFDLILGTFATVLAAVLTYSMREFFRKNKLTLMFFPLPTILSNAFIVGSYLPFITGTYKNMFSVLYCVLTVGIGEVLVLYILGLPLYYLVRNRKLFK